MKTRLLALLLIFATTAAIAAEPEVKLVPHPQVEIVTSMGTMKLELETAQAPVTVAHFLGLVESGFYDGLVFHRVIPDFMIQTGGHTPDMALREDDATIINESGNSLSNIRGNVAMARTGDPHSANSQFFINVADNLQLDPNKAGSRGRWGYAVFGYVIEGMDVADKIAAVETTTRGEHQNVPVEPVIIEKATRVN